MYTIQNTNMKQYFIMAAMLLCHTSGAWAQEILTLRNVLDKIDSSNPVSRMYDAQIRSSEAAAKGAYSWEAPQVGGGFWMVPYLTKYIYTKNGEVGMGQFMLSAQQMFPNKTKQDAQANYLKALSSVDKEKKKAALNDVYANAKKYYYLGLISKKKLTVISESEKVLTFMLKSAEISFKNNVGSLNAYYKAEAALGNLKNTRLVVERDITQAQIALNTLMNRNRSPFEVDTSYVIRDYMASEFDTSRLVSSRSDIKALERSSELSRLQQVNERAGILPEVSVRFDHMIGLGGLPMQYNLQAMVKIPISKSSRAAKATIESLHWKDEALQQERQLLINDISGMAFSIQNDIGSKKKQLLLFKEQIIPSLRKNFQVIQLNYEQNTGQLFELYDAWEALNNVQLTYTDLLKDLLSLQVDLERILEIK